MFYAARITLHIDKVDVTAPKRRLTSAKKKAALTMNQMALALSWQYVPMRTGALRASGRANEKVVTYGAGMGADWYVNPVHRGVGAVKWNGYGKAPDIGYPGYTYPYWGNMTVQRHAGQIISAGKMVHASML